MLVDENKMRKDSFVFSRLTEEGQKEARRVAEELRKFKPKTTDLIKAVQNCIHCRNRLENPHGLPAAYIDKSKI